MGFLVFCVGFTILYMLYDVFIMGCAALKIIGQILVMLFESIYKHRLFDKYEDDYIKIQQEREIEENIRIQKRIDEENKKQFEAEKHLALGILDKVNELKFKYPYANPNLFHRYMTNFNLMTLDELENLEKKMEISHYNNLQSKRTITKTYNYADIENLVPMESKFEYPIDMKVYKIDMDYIVAIKNLQTAKIVMYQSKNYMSILQLCNSIINELYKIKNQKLSIQAFNIDDVSTDIMDLFKI